MGEFEVSQAARLRNKSFCLLEPASDRIDVGVTFGSKGQALRGACFVTMSQTITRWNYRGVSEAAFGRKRPVAR